MVLLVLALGGGAAGVTTRERVAAAENDGLGTLALALLRRTEVGDGVGERVTAIALLSHDDSLPNHWV